jgi:hypothetical protein
MWKSRLIVALAVEFIRGIDVCLLARDVAKNDRAALLVFLETAMELSPENNLDVP